MELLKQKDMYTPYKMKGHTLPGIKQSKKSPIAKNCFKMVDESPVKKKDACYYKAKRAHKVFPSAYASGMIAKCRKNKGK